MKIAISSDIHDNLVNLKKFLNWSRENKIERIFCTGDICNRETLKFLAENFKEEIFLVKGNVELYEEDYLKSFSNIKYFNKIGIFEIEKYKIGLCHEPFLVDKILEKEDVDYIFYGHTHKPWTEERIGAKIYNPGTLGGVFYKATFAMWDTDKDEVELKILETL